MKFSINFGWTIPIEDYGNIKPSYEISLSSKTPKTKEKRKELIKKLANEITILSDEVFDQIVSYFIE